MAKFLSQPNALQLWALLSGGWLRQRDDDRSAPSACFYTALADRLAIWAEGELCALTLGNAIIDTQKRGRRHGR